MKEIVAEITRLARRSPDVNQRSGVSRARIDRQLREPARERAAPRRSGSARRDVVPRISDLPYVIPTISGKVEFETVEDGKEEQIIEKLIQGAVVAVFNRYFNVVDLEDVVTRFKAGMSGRSRRHACASKSYVELDEVDRRAEPRRREARPGREPGAHRQRVGVHLRRPAPEQAAEQGQGRREDAVPRLDRRDRRDDARRTAVRRRVRGTEDTMVAFRYSEWDGTQEIPPLDPDEVLEALTDDLMNFGDLQHAMRNLLQRGMRDHDGQPAAGPARPAAAAAPAAPQQLDKYNLSSVLDDIKKRLDEILEMEREHHRPPPRRGDRRRRTARSRRSAAEQGAQDRPAGADAGGPQAGAATAGQQRSGSSSAVSRRAAAAHGGSRATQAQQGGGSRQQGGQPGQAGDNDQFAEMLKNIAEPQEELPRQPPAGRRRAR